MWPRKFGHHREAEWWVADGLLFVWASAYGEKVTQLGGMPPENLARLLLSESISEHHARATGGLTKGEAAT
jgi:hypothetical protein